MRLLEGADIYHIARNCRTSVEMIQKHYAAHIRNMTDTAAINVIKRKRRAMPAKKKSKPASKSVASKQSIATAPAA